ncbi:hypothetical protein [Pasteurella testudinis]|uniref:hypothetical protein n=1 Tax=Pasteurella testudinis TaxID=761 RepID=UPI00405A1F72
MKIKDVADWMTTPEFDQIYPRAKPKDSNLSQRATLILTNEGWKSERLMKNF